MEITGAKRGTHRTHDEGSWFRHLRHLGLGSRFCLSFVCGVEPDEALRRLGAPPETIQPMTFLEAQYHSYASHSTEQPLGTVAVNFGDWTLLVEQNDFEAPARVGELSRRAEVVMVCNGPNDSFSYSRNGIVGATFNTWEHYVGMPSVKGPLTDELTPFVAQLHHQGLPRDVELACLITGVRPQPTDFDGMLLGSRISRSARSRGRSV